MDGKIIYKKNQKKSLKDSRCIFPGFSNTIFRMKDVKGANVGVLFSLNILVLFEIWNLLKMQYANL